MTAPTDTLALACAFHWGAGFITKDSQNIAAAIDAHIRAVLAEERGRGEQAHAWSNVVTALDEVMPGWSEGFQAWGAIRQLAQDAKDATARAEKAEDALEQLQSTYDMTNELWGADRKRAELAEAELAKLRAQLDAMTGEQQPYMTVLDHSKTERIPLYRHPSPAARVVGEMLVVQKGEMRTVSSTWNDEMLTTPPDVGTYRLSITPNKDGAQ